MKVVAGFPLGVGTTPAKLAESELALSGGATGIDVVLAIGDPRAGSESSVALELELLARAVHGRSGILKVIPRACPLPQEERVLACHIAQRAGANFVKTSTGFAFGGATVEILALLRASLARGWV